ncbi:MAG: hypothetical protein V1779_00595, partial [bacterium]
MKTDYYNVGRQKKMNWALIAVMLLISLPAMAIASSILNENTYDFSKFSKQRDLMTFNGFIENKGQIVDQSGELMNEAKFLYKNKNFKCVLKEAGFSY